MHIEEKLEKIEQKLNVVIAQQAVSSTSAHSENASEEINLYELVCVLWRGKWLILATTVLCALAAVLYALSIENVYRSEALLAPAEETSGVDLARLRGSLGGIASLAGVSFSGGGSNKIAIAIEVLKSREFLSGFIERHNLLPTLLAVNAWDKKQNRLIYDTTVYNPEKDEWLMVSADQEPSKPTLLDAYEQFLRVMTVSQNDKAGLIRVSVEHYSPYIAKPLVDTLVRDINDELKRRDVAEAKESIQYLSGQLEEMLLADMKNIFYELIEEQTKIVMFAKVREEYVFKTIDRAVVPEKKTKPRRALICLVAVFIGGMLSAVAVLVRWFLIKNA